jgi:hypothetical protein
LRYGKKGSLAIEIDGEKTGTWYDHEQGVGGDALDLIGKQYGLKNGAALDWARDWLGLPAFQKGTQHIEIQSASPHPETEPSQDETAPSLQSDAASASPTPQQRAAKVADIVSKCTGLEGTPAQFYLRRRGITIMPPDCIRFRPYAYGGFGALVALATDDNGTCSPSANLSDNDGQKAPVDIVKRTNKAVDGWSAQAAVRFPGAGRSFWPKASRRLCQYGRPRA